MKVSRRSFLKIMGATPIAAYVPFSVTANDEAPPDLSQNVCQIMLRNLMVGDSIGIFEALSRDKIFTGKATGNVLDVKFHHSDPVDIFIVVRNRDYVDIRIDCSSASEKLVITLARVKDQIVL